jgi:hypothetical protein
MACLGEVRSRRNVAISARVGEGPESTSKTDIAIFED